MKITIYELLGMVKDGKAPNKIKYQDEEYIINKICLEDNKTHIDYYLKGRELLLFEDMISIINLNDTVEILEEEKKIPLKINKIIPSQNYVILDSKNNSVDERLEIIKRLYADELYMLDIANTINEIIDYLDYLKSKGE